LALFLTLTVFQYADPAIFSHLDLLKEGLSAMHFLTIFSKVAGFIIAPGFCFLLHFKVFSGIFGIVLFGFWQRGIKARLLAQKLVRSPNFALSGLFFAP